MERRTQYGIYLLVFLIAGISVYGLLCRLNGGRQTPTGADLHITASGLAGSFEGNEGFADSLYLYKVISVSGVVQQLIVEGKGNYIARLAGARGGKAAVDCLLDSVFTRDGPGLRTGDSVTIRGTCAGHWVNIALLDCIVEK